MSIKHGVHQGGVGSPPLFAMYTEIIKRSLEIKGSFRISGRRHNIQLVELSQRVWQAAVQIVAKTYHPQQWRHDLQFF